MTCTGNWTWVAGMVAQWFSHYATAVPPMLEISNNIVLKCWEKHNNNCKCHCRSKPNCPLSGECLIQCLVYKATPAVSNSSVIYYGTSEGKFKTQYNNHTKLIRHCECMNESELSKHLWNIIEHGFDNNLLWEIHKKPSQYHCGSKCCNLCFSKKVSIICAHPDTLLNKRTNFQVLPQKYIFVDQH